MTRDHRARAADSTATARPPVADLLHLGKYYPPEPGGIEQVVESLIESTRGALRHCAILATRTGRSRMEESPGVRLVFLRQWGTFLLAPILPTLPFVLHRLRRRARIPVILLHVPNPLAVVALALSLALRPKRERIAVWYHCDATFDAAWKRAVHALYLPFERFVFRRADLFLTATPHHITSYHVLESHQDRTEVVPFAVDDTWLAPPVRPGAQSDGDPSPPAARFILFVGRLAEYKGLDTLLRAAPEIEAQVVLVGDGPLAGEIRRQIRELSLESKVTLVGHVGDLRPWYAGCELLVLPSKSELEAFGLVQLEAMALGKPVVSSDLKTGVTWVNRDGETGLTFPVGDSRALAAACNRLLADDALRARLGATARRRVSEQFSTTALRQRLTAVIGKLTSTGAP